MKATKSREIMMIMKKTVEKKTVDSQKVDLNINLCELQLIWEILFNKLSGATNKKITIGDLDMYWSVRAPECYDMMRKPNLVVGSLRDDIDELRKLLEDKDRPAAFINLDRFAAVLYAISQKLNPL
jgi:hypothetical protein